jgi:hypothetical protein
MKFKLDRIISLATLAASLVAIILVLKRPAPVAQPQVVTIAPHSPDSADPKTPPPQQPASEQPASRPQAAYSQPQTLQTQAVQARPNPAATQNSKPQANVNSETISAMLGQVLGAASGTPGLTPDSNVGSGTPNIKDQQVTMEGDIVHGRFLTEIAGKDVWVTISGHMGQKDGYATFDPTEFRVGDMEVPVSLVNPELQRKLSEERDRLKLPDGTSN